MAACQDAPTAPSAAPRPEAASAQTGWIFDVDGTPIEVRYSVIGGRAIHEGDIDLGPAGSVPATRQALVDGEAARAGGPRHGVTINGSTYRWANGVVPYVISASFSTAQRQMILDAMAHVTANTPGLTFRARTSESSYASFATSTNSCSSPVGRRGGAQTISLAPGCFVLGIVVHEILHTAGMWHEQSRCDRDTYVTINLSNVTSGQEHNFDKKCSGNSTVFAYDEGSVMHYDPYAFSRNGLPTITSKRGLDYLMGQRSGMSAQDARTAVWLYPTTPSITYVDDYAYNPVIYWTDTRAVQYDVYLVTEERWNHAYDGSGTSTWRSFLGSTTGTSLEDYHVNTGQYSCDTTRDPYYEQREEVYSYEVVAVYGHGVTRTSYRWGAPVGQC
jgi:hypothetical protein